MTVQANWHLDGLDLPDEDPMQEIAQLKSEAAPVVLTRTPEEIFEEFSRALRKENDYDAYADLTCSLKWGEPDSRGQVGERNPCYTCPKYTTDTSDDPLGLLCALGRQQNDLLDELEAAKAEKALDIELMDAFERDVASCEEMAAALL